MNLIVRQVTLGDAEGIKTSSIPSLLKVYTLY